MESMPGGKGNYRPNRKPFRIFLVCSLILIFLLGCEYTAMPTLIPTLQGSQPTAGIQETSLISSIYLPDASKIVIKIESEITVPNLPSTVNLLTGEILVKSRLPDGNWFTVVSPHGYLAKVTGSIMVVTYDSLNGIFTLNCIIGRCQIGPDENRLTEFRGGEKGWIDLGGNFHGPAAYDIDLLRPVYGDENLTEEAGSEVTFTDTPTATITETPTPSSEATITETPTPNWVATATAACIIFHSKHPSTPCPH